MQLWAPILATAVLIFIASSLIHMVFKWHNSDYNKLDNEDAVRAAILAGSPAPAQYVLPHCNDMKEMGSEVMIQKYTEGPVAVLTIMKSGPPKMGGTLTMWFIYSVVVAAIVGCLALAAYPGKANASSAGSLVAVATFMTYVGGSVPFAIWLGKPWGSVAKDALDGVIYAAISGVTFMMLWP